MGILLQTVKFGTRVGVAGLAVAYTSSLGFWSADTEDGRKLYDNARNTIVPGTIVYPEKLPTTDDVVGSATCGWNIAVKSLFGGIRSAPDYLGKLGDKFFSSDENPKSKASL